MRKLILLALVSSYAYANVGVTEINAPKSYCKDEVTCETSCKNAPVRIVEKIIYKDKEKIVYRDKPVEKIVYRDKPVEKEKIVYVDKPVEKIVYKDKIVEKEKIVYKNGSSKPNGKLQLNVLAGVGENGLYTELDEETGKYEFYKDNGFVGGAMFNYRFDNDLTVGLGALTNETFISTIGISTNLLD